MTDKTPFTKILIANRGEIALRVMRTARALGYRSVAVYSSADRHARHVRDADQAVCIGEALPAQSYLNIPAIIDAARRSGADAVHPGYGFLAENADFAQACRDAGLVFIGPSPAAIVAMGNKAGAKRLMLAAGVPCIPGYQGDDQRDDTLAAAAREIGFPLMIKATAGGGGRGMRLVQGEAQFAAELRSARSEAHSAFGSPEVILERAILEPRHIEMQIFADRHGNVIHLGERDCSVQRRHQKVIEEAPSPAVDAALRQRMGDTAVAAARAIGYEGAGTLEFLLDAEGRYYFMEMNTRLQVEHPVTELITGLDLVELQLRVAAGEVLPLTQAAVRFSGHAVEVRLCAEAPSQGFMPQSGTMHVWQMPAEVRVEHALASGEAIPPFYDSMIAKLIAHGENREAACRKLARALDDAVALGVPTNQHYLARCLRHPVFLAGHATTAFIAAHGEALLQAGPLPAVSEAPTSHPSQTSPISHTSQRAGAPTGAQALATLLLHVTAGEAGPAMAASLSAVPAGCDITHRLPIDYRFTLDGAACATRLLDLGAGRFAVTVAGEEQVLSLAGRSGHALRYLHDGLLQRAACVRDGASLWFDDGAAAYHVEDSTHAAATRNDGGDADGRIRAAMNGRVVAVHVAVGDTVAAGQPVLTLEAMKMEYVHPAPLAGRVGALHAEVGGQVAAYRVVAEIAPEPAVGQGEAPAVARQEVA
ncbi:acetyl-CoA carboxylase biotin carboxylase subunit [Thauera linaloolentis]|uniref:Methylcrotonoyl-CoA carboxylase n=1 Tax=Thauera linaloolentis (strain DSM 12138 / JCM 21573 / CCUG 41526 / CIP 105981 / IAM 15112 / NBRC 102519 / 47Lol) TaxID=1123367 RepID=N6YYA5_THAL4|nr:acetyl-CoA carboxylase biotin carboxylase subunit [Thauera linaloolentis]ENO87362.1 methylcrotonoyl-CoA carboxylase [Thauera linaloolentis 47Lol = DSM 12138]MCM8565476.1 acetyl-CoA carboxylase biotin carboxylase subunit [Thauera linaloolentis]